MLFFLSKRNVLTKYLYIKKKKLIFFNKKLKRNKGK
jgi:hypothetical protein